MAAKITIGYFLEDRGHEIFLKAMVARMAREKGFRPGEWSDDVRAATGGQSIREYRKFLNTTASLFFVDNRDDICYSET